MKTYLCIGAVAMGVAGFGAAAQAETWPRADGANALLLTNPLQLADGTAAPVPRRRVMRQEPPPPPAVSPWYVLLSAGAAFPANTRFSALGIGGSLDYDTGFHVFGGIGYRFSRWLAAELELGYLHLPIDGISLPGATVSVDGTARGLALFGNLVLTYPEWHWIKPYIAGGPGFVHRFGTDFTATAGGTTVTGNLGSATDFALQAKAGIDLRLTDSMSIAPEYRFHWINTSGDGVGNTHVHSVGASLKFNF